MDQRAAPADTAVPSDAGEARDFGAEHADLARPSYCRDGARNGEESDIDCGGPCLPCSFMRGCRSDADCRSRQCRERSCDSALKLDEPDEIELSAGSPSAIVIADLNNDRTPDIIVGIRTSPVLVVLRGLGGGKFASPNDIRSEISVGDALAGDLDRDGRIDLVAISPVARRNPGAVAAIRGNGVGGFAPPVLYDSGGDGPFSAISIDLNGDGHLDLAVANSSSNTIGVLKNRGDGTFGPPEVYRMMGGDVRFIHAGDFDGDGRVDLVTTGGFSGILATFAASAPGEFKSPVMLRAGGDLEGIAVDDMNGDGAPDLVVADAMAGVSTLLNRGGGFVVPPRLFPLRDIQVVAVADLDADGEGDVVAVSRLDKVMRVLIGDGSGGGAIRSTRVIGVGQHDVAIADLDGNGRLDIVVCNYGSQSVSIILNRTP